MLIGGGALYIALAEGKSMMILQICLLQLNKLPAIQMTGMKVSDLD